MDKEKYLAVVTGDWNDGDTVNSQSFIDKETVEKIKKVIPLIERAQTQKGEEFSPHLSFDTIIEDLDIEMDSVYSNKGSRYGEDGYFSDWEENCKFTQEEVELILWFNAQFMPYGYDMPCHTLTNVEIYEIKDTILDHILKTRYYDRVS